MPRPQRRETEHLWAYLLLHHEVAVSRDRVAFDLWPDVPEADARANLRRQLHWLDAHLQSQTGRGTWIVRDRRMVRWQPVEAWRLDVAEFESALLRAQPGAADTDADRVLADLEAAVEGYGEGLLPEWEAPWLGPFRDRLAEHLLQALDRLSDLLERSDRLERAIDVARRRLARDGGHEPTHRRLMRLHYRAGDRGAAVAQLNECTAALSATLGVAPTAETLALGRPFAHRGPSTPSRKARPGTLWQRSMPAPARATCRPRSAASSGVDARSRPCAACWTPTAW